MNNNRKDNSVIAIHKKKKQLYMDQNTSSTIGGYACAIIAVLGAIVNIITFIVLGLNKKLNKCPTTVIVLALTAFNIVYNVLILPFQSVMYLERGYVFHKCISWIFKILIHILRFFKGTESWCQLFAFSFYAHTGFVLFTQGVLGLSRWAAVCTQYK